MNEADDDCRNDNEDVIRDLDSGELFTKRVKLPPFQKGPISEEETFLFSNNFENDNLNQLQLIGQQNYVTGRNISCETNNLSKTTEGIENLNEQNKENSLQHTKSVANNSENCIILETPLEKESDKFARSLILFLKNDADGKLVFLHFKEHECLDKESRGILVRTIIRKFKDDALKTVEVGKKLEKFYISTKILAEIAKLIENNFYGEVASTYFSPYKSENGIIFQTCGALWSHYQYTIGSLRAKGLLELPKEKKSTKINICTSNRIKALEEASMNNLQNRLQEDTLIQDWIITFNLRRILLSVNKLSVTEYIHKFPCLRTQETKTLIEEDFKLLQSNIECSNFCTRWPTIKEVIISQLNLFANKVINRKRKDGNTLDDLALIKLLPALNPNQQDAVVLQLLQLLINCNSLTGRRKSDGSSVEYRKYNFKEIREAFIYNVKVIGDLETEIQALKNKCLERRETFQPTVFVIGELTAISEVYVVLDSERYKCESTLDAVDFALKLFFSLDCSYPKAAHRLWQFIQIAGFEIDDQKANKSVKELVGLVKQAFKNPKH